MPEIKAAMFDDLAHDGRNAADILAFVEAGRGDQDLHFGLAFSA
jgi:hypothetical protein